MLRGTYLKIHEFKPKSWFCRTNIWLKSFFFNICLPNAFAIFKFSNFKKIIFKITLIDCNSKRTLNWDGENSLHQVASSFYWKLCAKKLTNSMLQKFLWEHKTKNWSRSTEWARRNGVLQGTRRYGFQRFSVFLLTKQCCKLLKKTQ